MDRRERSSDLSTLLMSATKGAQSNIWTALPAIVAAVNLAKQTVDVNCALTFNVEQANGTLKETSMPLIRDCPIYFPHGGGITMTFPVTAGDECLLVFASRCIDSWWQNGGVMPQAEFRMHSLSDGMAFVGFSSVPKVLGGISASNAQIRNASGNVVVEVDPSGQVNLTAPTIHINGTLIINGTPYLSHTHGGVQPGGSNTGGVS